MLWKIRKLSLENALQCFACKEMQSILSRRLCPSPGARHAALSYGPWNMLQCGLGPVNGIIINNDSSLSSSLCETNNYRHIQTPNEQKSVSLPGSALAHFQDFLLYFSNEAILFHFMSPPLKPPVLLSGPECWWSRRPPRCCWAAELLGFCWIMK